MMDLYAKSPKPVTKPDDVVVLKDDSETVPKSSKKKNKKSKQKKMGFESDDDLSDESEEEFMRTMEEGRAFVKDDLEYDDKSPSEAEILDDFAKFKADSKAKEKAKEKESLEESTEEEALSEFEKIKLKAAKAKEALLSASSEKKPKKSRPSEFLKSHLNKRLSVDLENIHDLDSSSINTQDPKSSARLTNGTSQNKQVYVVLLLFFISDFSRVK